MNVLNLANLDTDCLAEFGRAVAGHASMLDALNWAIARSPEIPPERIVANVVVQDEYTHDVVIQAGGGLFLVYGTS